MIKFLKTILPRIEAFSNELEIAEAIIDKPWVWITENGKNQKLIFRRGGVLLMVENGQVNTGSWEVIPSLKCILIDRSADKLLMNYAFANDAVMLLRKDSTDDIFAFVNEVKLPDLDFQKYLEELSTGKVISKPQLAIDIEPVPPQVVELPKTYKATFRLQDHLGQQTAAFTHFPSNNPIDAVQLLQWVWLHKATLKTGNDLNLNDGFYLVAPDVAARVPDQKKIPNTYYQLINGIPVNKFGTQILNGQINGQDVMVFKKHYEGLKDSGVFYKKGMKPIENGRHKWSFMCYLITENGIVIFESIWP